MKRHGMLTAAAAIFAVCTIFHDTAFSQEPQTPVQSPAVTDSLSVPEGYEQFDTIIYRPAATVDTSLVGKNIFREMPLKIKGNAADVMVHQSADIAAAMERYFEVLPGRTISGYRVRIFFDNKQSSRTASEETYNAFVAKYHDVTAYRSYVNPYFKVTVGDFRTKSEAMQLLRRIKHEFPSAFIVKENINYPVIDKNNAVTADTVRMLRPVNDSLVVKLN